ncbi:TonB-dependent receptor [Steroidobacter cummioxidans]|uniref:TonB-dependent receptor n=1 Tax=Steroidobacter cummioxidans TaxID=1803913 RepID=UPI00137B74D7|nr:TonB-dependent receptor [Steroidobacter cummioxidans]
MKLNRTAKLRGKMLYLGASTLLYGFGLTAQVQAQSQTREEPARSADRDTTIIEDIVVTAERRSEGLQNVPIAITAISGDTLQEAGVSSVGELVQLAPSLQFGERFGNVFIAVRGIGQAGQDIGSQSGVTVSQDGVPLLNHFMMDGTFLDVSQVAVLRGPQGTFEGRNATGGAINVYSNQPTSDFDGAIAVTAGEYDRLGVRGFFSGPLVSDRLMARVAFQKEEADGWLRNDYLGIDKNDTDLTQVRASLLGKVTDDFTVRAIFEATRDRGDAAFATVLGRARPDRPTAVEALGLPQNDLEGRVVYMNRTDQRDTKNQKSILIANWDVSPSVALTSTSGYIRHELVMTDTDNDGTTGDFSDFPYIAIRVNQFTQDLTATADLSSTTDLIVGAFYMQGESSQPLILSVPPSLIAGFVYHPVEKLDSYAVYAQLRHQLTDSLRVTVGGRYTIDEKDFEMDAQVIGANVVRTADDSWGAFTPRFVIDYVPNDNTLLYVSASRGFKSGGFNTFGDVSQPVNLFNPEFVWNYEAGLKAAFFDRALRMGVTGFYSDYTNLQQTLFRINPQTNVRYPRVENAASAGITGVELDVEAIPFRGLRLKASATWLDAQFGRFSSIDPIYPERGEQDLTGNRLPQAPTWQFGVSGQYSLPISSTLEVTARADYKWQNEIYFDLFNNPLNTQDSYGLLNASLAIGTQDQRWSLTAFIRNAFDERYVSQSVTSASDTVPARVGQLGAPSQYGVTLSHRF